MTKTARAIVFYICEGGDVALGGEGGRGVGGLKVGGVLFCWGREEGK